MLREENVALHNFFLRIFFLCATFFTLGRLKQNKAHMWVMNDRLETIMEVTVNFFQLMPINFLGNL